MFTGGLQYLFVFLYSFLVFPDDSAQGDPE